uniref:Uncharacterized protein n=1 Tax=Arundo donax TaxID=35708 RepID=A0A0A8Z1Q2_ARUDO
MGWLGRPRVPSSHRQSTFDWWQCSRSGLPKQKQKEIDSMFMLVAWTIWKEKMLRCSIGQLAQ